MRPKHKKLWQAHSLCCPPTLPVGHMGLLASNSRWALPEALVFFRGGTVSSQCISCNDPDRLSMERGPLPSPRPRRPEVVMTLNWVGDAQAQRVWVGLGQELAHVLTPALRDL